MLSIKTVDGVDDAIDRINHYGSGHSDAIISSDDTSKINFLPK